MARFVAVCGDMADKPIGARGWPKGRELSGREADARTTQRLGAQGRARAVGEGKEAEAAVRPKAGLERDG
jgi:hypothetical protein